MAILAYHGDAGLRAKYIARAKAHREADELVQRYGYWTEDRDGRMKGCAIGCLAHVDEGAHEALEEQAGLPAVLSGLADAIFECLPNPDYKNWPERYASAAKEGADLSRVHNRFCAWVLTDFFRSSLSAGAWIEVEAVCSGMAELHRREAEGETVQPDEWAAARAAARAVARAAARAARYAARAAARDAWDAWDVARGAARAARDAAWYAAWDARDAWDAVEDASDAAWYAAWKAMADKLVELMAAAKGGA